MDSDACLDDALISRDLFLFLRAVWQQELGSSAEVAQ